MVASCEQVDDDAASRTENHPEALTWARPTQPIHTTPRIWLNQSLHCGNATNQPYTHTHTQFSHGLKLERARWKIAEEAQFCCHTRPMGAKKGFYFIITSPARLLIAFLILSYPPLSPIKVKGVKIQNSTVVAPYQSGHAICNG